MSSSSSVTASRISGGLATLRGTKSSAKIAMGHLELNGFKATRGHTMEDGMDVNVFNKFNKVFSGHFHNSHIPFQV